MKINTKKTCGILGLVIIAVGVTLAYRGIPLIDWVSLVIGSFLLTYATSLGDRVLLYDRIRRRQ